MAEAGRDKPTIRGVSEWGMIAAVLGIFWLVLAWVTVSATQEVGSNLRLVAHTHDVMHHLAALQSRVTDVETAQRGYVITGDERYLAPAAGAEEDTDDRLDALTALTRDNRLQLANVERLRTTVDRRLADARRVIDLRRSAGMAAAQAYIMEGHGRLLHDQFRNQIRSMLEIERALLENRQRISAAAQHRSQLGLYLALILVGGGIIVALWLSRTRFQAMERLIASETRYRQLFEASPLPKFVVAPDNGHILFANEAAAIRYGHSSGRLATMTIEDLFAPDEHARLGRTLHAGRSVDQARSGYWTMCTAQARAVRVDASFHAVDFDGQSAVMIVADDVTDQERAIGALKASEQRFLTIFDQQVQYMALLRPGGMVVMANELFVQATGMLHAHVLGSNVSALPVWNRSENGGASPLARAFEAFDRGRRDTPFELTIRNEDGSMRVLEASFQAMETDPAGIEQVLFHAHDITARVRAADAVLASERRLNAAQQRVQLGSWEYDLRSGDAWWSDFTFRLFGLQKGVIPKGIDALSTLIHPDDHVRLSAFVEGLRDAIGPSTVRLRRHPDIGDPCHIEVVTETVYDEDGRATHLVGSVLDITERLAIEGRLQQSQRLEAVGALTGGIAHDFNNLLTIVIGNSEALEEMLAVDQPDMAELASLSLRAALRGSELTQQLLAFARRQPLEPQVVDPYRLISDMRQLLAKSLGGGVELEVVAAPGGWRVFVDPVQLESSILNLAINARDAMTDGGRVTIEVSNTFLDQDYADAHADTQPGQYVMIAVSDTGSGMARNVIERAFEPFFTTKRQGARTGLGLSMVHGFIKQSGGHIKIYSELGVGTTIKVYLKRTSGPVTAGPVAGPPRAMPRGNEHILLVEDDPLVRNHVANQLGKLGYRVEACESAADALAALERHGRFDLLFTDIVMPGGMNGRELAGEAVRRWPDMPVLFTSGYTENAIVHHGRLDSGVNLLTKPYRLQTLAHKVRYAIDTLMESSE